MHAEALRTMPLVGIAPYTGTFGKDELTHLIKRTMFGGKKSDIDFFSGKTLAQVVDALLTPPTTEPAPPLNNYNSTTNIDPRVPAGTTWVYDLENGTFNSSRANSLRYWWAGNMVNQSRSIHEKMVLFWSNHFGTNINVTSPTQYYWHLVMLRRNALGNFKTFLKEVTLDANMLHFLNGYRNVKQAPDENYAREVQELFSVGKGPNSKYLEADVKAAAKVLTGWDIKQEGFKLNPSDTKEPLKYKWVSYFKQASHDVTDKTFSAFYKNTVIKGVNTATGGEIEIDALIHMLLATDEAAKFLVRKFYRFFVYYEITPAVETEVITPLATIFRQSYDIKAVLKALFNSQHFFDAAGRNALIKSPIDHVVGMAREFDAQFPAATDYLMQYKAWSQLINNGYGGADQQGQAIGNPPNVAGWPAYYQEPSYHEFWLNTDTLPKRLRFSDTFTSGGFYLSSTSKLGLNVLTFTDQFGTDAYDPNLLIQRVLEHIYRVPVSAAFKTYVKTTILLGGQVSDHYWSDAWTQYKTNPTNVNINIVQTRLAKLYKFLTERPEYQLS